nr:hypothetical protein [Candidatus Sigynarchaeota archaeon]
MGKPFEFELELEPSYVSRVLDIGASTCIHDGSDYSSPVLWFHSFILQQTSTTYTAKDITNFQMGAATGDGEIPFTFTLAGGTSEQGYIDQATGCVYITVIVDGTPIYRPYGSIELFTAIHTPNAIWNDIQIRPFLPEGSVDPIVPAWHIDGDTFYFQLETKRTEESESEWLLLAGEFNLQNGEIRINGRHGFLLIQTLITV